MLKIDRSARCSFDKLDLTNVTRKKQLRLLTIEHSAKTNSFDDDIMRTKRNCYVQKYEQSGIRTHASEETRALIWRLRPLGHLPMRKYDSKFILYMFFFFRFERQTLFYSNRNTKTLLKAINSAMSVDRIDIQGCVLSAGAESLSNSSRCI
jgi:hypothetical protein